MPRKKVSDNSNLAFAPITDVAQWIRTCEISPVELTTSMLERISRFNPDLNVYLDVAAESAIDTARGLADEVVGGNYRGPLHGIPVGVKDLFAVAGAPMTCGSRVLSGNVAANDANVVARLRAAGAIVIGMLNMTEFAYAGYHSSLPAPLNPWGRRRWPGLSSSGSGAATAAGLCYAALGTDTGGSIRYPSAANGIVGIKPTFGRVSRHGVYPLSHTLDHVGPMARTVADAALVLGVIAGPDVSDPFAVRAEVPDYSVALDAGVVGLRIGIDERYVSESVSDDVAAAVMAAAAVLEHEGATLRAIQVPSFDAVLTAWPLLCGVDAALAHERTFPVRAHDYGKAMRDLLALGRGCVSLRYADALIARERVSAALAGLFEDIDVLICPALASEAPVVDDREDETGCIGPAFLFAAPYNMSGSPSVTLSCGFSRGGMPLSLQLIGRHFEEATLIAAAGAYERSTDWHSRHPELAGLAAR